MKTTWKLVEDGYHKEWHFIDDLTERIIGVVRGSTYTPNDGWYARAEESDGTPRHFGRYTSIPAAKEAVRMYWEDTPVEAEIPEDLPF